MTVTLSDYTQLGWHIFPCHNIENGRCSCGSADCNSPGKHPRTVNGVKAATTDIETIRGWAARYPHANWALACGRESGVVAVDIDPRKGGFDSFQDFEEQRHDATESFADTLISKTGGGGRHIFVVYPPDVVVPNRVNWLPGVDIRSDGGYVILPPGNHISGGSYEWKNWGRALMPAPADFVKLVSSTTGRGGLAASDLGKTDDLLAGLEEGSRDDTLFRLACRLRRQLQDNRAAVTILVMHAAASANPPFPEAEAVAKIEQAFKQEHTDPDDIFSGGDDADSGEPPVSRLTDVGNRDRFVRVFGDDYRYVVGVGWHQWADDGWKPVSELVVQEVVADGVPETVRQEATTVADVATRARFMRWANDSESNGRISACMNLVRGHSVIRKTPDDFDNQPHLIACRNGMLDLRDGSIRSFEREDLFTRNTGVIYDPTCKLAAWDKFLDDVTDGDEDLKEYLQMAAGYTLTGSIAEECFFIISGMTQSGKSTYIDGLMAALGRYAEVTPAETFMKKWGKETPREEIVKMAGARFIGTAEISEDERFDDALLKRLTGGDPISARFLFAESFTFLPQFKLWMATNHDPVTSDSAMFRRIKRVPFLHQIPEEKRDRKLKEMMKNPDVGGRVVLAWAVQGAIKYFEKGALETPAKVLFSTNTYQAEQDAMAHFLNETYSAVPGNEINIKAVFHQWSEWCKDNNEKAGRRPQFISKLKEKGFELVMKESTGDSYVLGLQLRMDVYAQ